MKKQLIFTKNGRLRFVGHLDLMRTLQRAMTRAEIPLSYSQGFNPHAQLSFAAPLALGWGGEREIMEIKIERDMDDDVILTSLNAQLPEGIHMVSCQTLPDQTANAMSLIAAASYRIEFAEDLSASLEAFLNQPEIKVMKPGKVKGRKTMLEVDVKPWVYEFSILDPHTVTMLAAAGSEKNLKPELLLDSFYESLGRPDLQYSQAIIRTGFYIQDGDRLALYPPEENAT